MKLFTINKKQIVKENNFIRQSLTSNEMFQIKGGEAETNGGIVIK